MIYYVSQNKINSSGSNYPFYLIPLLICYGGIPIFNALSNFLKSGSFSNSSFLACSGSMGGAIIIETPLLPPGAYIKAAASAGFIAPFGRAGGGGKAGPFFGIGGGGKFFIAGGGGGGGPPPPSLAGGGPLAITGGAGTGGAGADALLGGGIGGAGAATYFTDGGTGGAGAELFFI